MMGRIGDSAQSAEESCLQIPSLGERKDTIELRGSESQRKKRNRRKMRRKREEKKE